MGYVIAGLAGILIGWVLAHNEVARECRMQGNFYVGKTVYYCDPTKKEQTNEPR